MEQIRLRPPRQRPIGGTYACSKTIKTSQVRPWALIHPITRGETVQTESQTTTGLGRFILLFVTGQSGVRADLSSHCKLNPRKRFCQPPPPPRHPPSLLRRRNVPTEEHRMGGTPSLSLRPEGQDLGCPCHTHTKVRCACCPLVTFDFKKASAKGGPGFSSAKGVVIHGGVVSWSLGRQGPRCAAVSWSSILRGDEEGAEG